jgi:RNase P subunit RPR2
MPSTLPESEWEALTRALQQTIEAWRQTHPTATLDEIETIIDTQLAPVRAKLVEATAHASPRQDWQQAESAAQPRCARCGTPLVPRGRHRRRLQTTGGASIDLERTYCLCPTCGHGLFPPR